MRVLPPTHTALLASWSSWIITTETPAIGHCTCEWRIRKSRPVRLHVARYQSLVVAAARCGMWNRSACGCSGAPRRGVPDAQTAMHCRPSLTVCDSQPSGQAAYDPGLDRRQAGASRGGADGTIGSACAVIVDVASYLQLLLRRHRRRGAGGSDARGAQHRIARQQRLACERVPR